jgi:hypothetical protein
VEEEAVELAVLLCPYTESFTIRQADLRYKLQRTNADRSAYSFAGKMWTDPVNI